MQEIDNLRNHLKSKTQHFIDVLDAEAEKYIKRKLYLEDITREYGSLDNFFNTQLQKGISKLQIFRRKKQGSSSTLIGSVINLALGVKPEPSQEQQGLNNPNYNATSNVNHNANNAQETQMSAIFYRERMADLKEKIADLKEQIRDEKDKKRELHDKLEDCYSELRELKSEKHTFDKRMELALMQKDLETKSFLDSEGFKTLISGAKDTAEVLIGAKQAAAQGQLNAAPQYSEKKQALIKFINLDSVSDDICSNLYAVGVGIMQDAQDPKGFIQELQSLLIKYQLETT